MPEMNRYAQIIERIFFAHYKKGSHEVAFDREEIVEAAEALGIKLPKNLGDLIYTFRYRGNLPHSVCAVAPEGNEWVIMPAGRSRYKFVATSLATILPSSLMAETKVPDSTPGIISKYALNDEQALLAKLRYNRLVDIFTGVTCYSLQNHLRTAVESFGQVETDEVYVGIDKRGAQYVFPVQAKGIRDTLRIVQIAQDLAMCAAKLPSLICRPIAAQLMPDAIIAVFEFEQTSEGIRISAEKHYRLVPPDEVTDEDLHTYRGRQQ